MEFSRTNWYQYGVELMTAVSAGSGEMCSVNVKSMLEQRGIHGLLRTDFSLAIVDVLHRHFCGQKLGTSAQPGLTTHSDDRYRNP